MDYGDAVELFGSEAQLHEGIPKKTREHWKYLGQVPAHHVLRFARERNRYLEASLEAGTPRASKAVLGVLRELELAEQRGDITAGQRVECIQLAIKLLAISRHAPDAFQHLKLFIETLALRFERSPSRSEREKVARP